VGQQHFQTAFGQQIITPDKNRDNYAEHHGQIDVIGRKYPDKLFFIIPVKRKGLFPLAACFCIGQYDKKSR
jgi:hypothetical protein